MARCLITRELPGPAIARLAERHALTVWPGELPPTPAQLREQLTRTGAEGLLCTVADRIDAATLDAAPGLRAIANYAVGTDNIDLAAAAARGIAVGNTPDVLTDATADLAFALLLAAARRLPQAIATVRDGRWLTWEPARDLGAAVHGATLGIVGGGRIGEAVARRATGFAMEVLVHRRSGGTPLAELLARADFVSLHCPLTPETHHLIDAAALRAMKPTAFLINTARGGVVDQRALADALARGEIAGAALDVTDPEPLPAEDPLLHAPHLIVVPHIGSATHAAREAMSELAAANLCAALDGAPMPHPVGPHPRERAVMNVAVVDIGSNSTRLLVAELNGRRITERARDSTVTRLGAGVDRDGRLSAEAMDRVHAVLEGYAERLAEYGVARSVAVLTSAVRDSVNGGEFAQSIRDRYGIEPHVLEGEEEARLTYLGATSERDPADRTPTLVLDIGGGSTEIVIGAGTEVRFRVSTQAGVVRQSERHLPDDPPSAAQMRALVADVDAILADAVPEAQRAAVTRGIAVAGTATSLAAIAQGLEPYDPARVHGFRLSAAECGRILDALSPMRLAQRREVPGLHPDRAPTILAGVLIFREVVRMFGLSEIEISEHDILRGAILGLIAPTAG